MSMSPTQLERYLHDHIPLSQTMQVSCVSVTSESVVLRAPLGPNINHHATVFGGSASALAILAGWSLLHVRLHGASIACRLVIQRNTMEYERPIKGSFTAASALPEPQRWLAFLRMLERKGTARASVISELVYAGQVAGRFLGEFVALASDGT
jgi:thioesterase domain-containing protein